MKSILCGLVLAVWPGAAQAGESLPGAPITLYTHFDQVPSEEVADALHSEVETILEPAGVRFDWRVLEQASGGDVVPELVVATFVGVCDVLPAEHLPDGIGALGWTHMSGREILPFADVDCGRVRRLLGTAMAGVEPAERAPTMGRALGRVLAHELYHVLARTRRHGAHGLAKAQYTADELLADELRLDEKDFQTLRAARPAFGKAFPHHSAAGR